ncbi:hypothetical protein [Streptomyces sp. NPDC001601]|uniref:hypothetical protein n=1 Tax=Streptomyces sp. NPDC001601 TaxID=3364592 RepID=UPI00367FAF06
MSLSTFRRWVHENLPEEAARSKVTVLRENLEPGSEAQIDYGFLGRWINPATGKRHRIWAFVMVLPASRHMFVRPVAHMDSTPGLSRTRKRSASSTVSHGAWCRTTSRRGWTSRT